MVQETRDAFGRTTDFYVAEALREARRDIVAFGDIVSWAQNWPNTSDEEVDFFLRRILHALLDAGTKVMRPFETTAGYEWRELPEYAVGQTRERVDKLIDDSRRVAKGDQFFTWFAFELPKSKWPGVSDLQKS